MSKCPEMCPALNARILYIYSLRTHRTLKMGKRGEGGKGTDRTDQLKTPGKFWDRCVRVPIG